MMNKGLDGMIVAPTYDMLRLNTCPPINAIWPPELFKNPWAMASRGGPFDLMLKTGGKVIFRSAEEPEHLRGPNLAWAWMDEAGQMRRYAWEVVQGRVRLKCEMPCIAITTTPKGLNWLHDVFVLNPPSADYGITKWTVDENKCNLRPGFYEDLLLSYGPQLARQEIQAEFLNIDAISFLSAQAVQSAMTTHMPLFPRDRSMYLGVDVARSHDLTVMVGLYPFGELVLTGILRIMKGAKYSEQRKAISSLMPHVLMCCIDSTGLGNQLAEELHDEWGDAVLGVNFSSPEKAKMASRLRMLFDKQVIRIPADTELRNDLLSVETMVSETGNISYTAQRSASGHADRFWAYALASKAMGEGVVSEIPIASLW